MLVAPTVMVPVLYLRTACDHARMRCSSSTNPVVGCIGEHGPLYGPQKNRTPLFTRMQEQCMGRFREEDEEEVTHGAGLTGQGSRGRTHGAGLTGQDSRGKAHGAGLTGQDSRGNAHWARDSRGRTHGARAHRVFTRADTRSEVHTHRILTRTGSSHVLADTVLSQTVLADRLASVTFVRTYAGPYVQTSPPGTYARVWGCTRNRSRKGSQSTARSWCG